MPKIVISKILTDRDAKIIIGELALTEIEKKYSLREWKKELTLEIIKKILAQILETASIKDLEVGYETINIEHYAKKLQFFEKILKDLVCEDSMALPILSTEEDCEIGLKNVIDIVIKIAKEHDCSFQLTLEMEGKIEKLVEQELTALPMRRERVLEKPEKIDFDSIVKEIKPNLFNVGLRLAKKYHPILFEEKRHLVEEVTAKMLDRILDLDVKNAHKSIEYEYLERNSKRVKNYIQKEASESLEWWITNIFVDLLAEYEGELKEQAPN
ncbi:MAG: hypothetical protein ACFFCD_12235 [Promethearchaeota archaeon]